MLEGSGLSGPKREESGSLGLLASEKKFRDCAL